MAYDFSGYATKANLKCSDGRTIMPKAFQDCDGKTVPLVWQHKGLDAENILGHAQLQEKGDGVYAYCTFNDTVQGKNAKALVQHGDITSLSIFANRLRQEGSLVRHGAIREVSLVLTGANPGAYIDNVVMQHSDDGDEEVLEAIIFTGLPIEQYHEPIEHTEGTEMPGAIKHEDAAPEPAAGGKTVKDVFDSLTDEQKNVVYFLIGSAVDGNGGGSAAQSDYDDDYLEHEEEGYTMSRNVFEDTDSPDERPTLTHDELSSIVEDAKRCGSFKEAFLAHAGTYGINNIDILFPDAQKIRNSPDFIARRTEWVAGVLSGTSHSPFSRIKSTAADITQEDARAKGYIKGSLKKEEFFGLTKRTTGPTTIYKKQKLDRDDIIDITDLDVVAWLKAEMRVMLDEEIARAILIGDGRPVNSDDKIKDPIGQTDGTGIRSIAHESDFYAHQVEVPLQATTTQLEDLIIRSRPNYKGSGTPTLYTTEAILTDLLLQKDTTGRRIYASQAELESTLRVSKIVVVDLISTDPTLVGIEVNLSDYTVGADKGGAIGMFDDFDIDYNQYKYLMETRLSGALTLPKSALVFRKAAA